MPKQPERSFLDRALEALKERYPREKATQVRLAQLAGVKQPSVNEWREAAPAMTNGIRLAKSLGVCVEWLYTERGPKRPGVGAESDEYLSPIVHAWPELDESIKRRISRYADFIKDDK